MESVAAPGSMMLSECTAWLVEGTAVFDAIATGSISFTVSQHSPLAEAAQARRDLQGRKTVGSMVLVP